MKETETRQKIGVALGGGGARGLAHVPAYEVIEEAGIQPDALAGTSMGAILGAMFASGMSGKDVRAFVEHYFIPRAGKFHEMLDRPGILMRILSVVHLSWKRTGLLKADRFLRELLKRLEVSTFEELQIPLRVVATDFHTGEPVVFDSGPLLPALKASMAIPGAFVPLEQDGQVLVDGGMSHNLPYQLLPDACDVTIAVDVAPIREPSEEGAPNVLDATLGMFDILVDNQTLDLIRTSPPTVYFHPRLTGIRVLEFDKIDEVFRQTEVGLPEFRSRLEEIRPASDIETAAG